MSVLRILRGLAATGDANDPYAGSAYYGTNSGDTFYDTNPQYVYQPDPNDTGLINQFINKFNDAVAQLDQQIANLQTAQTNLIAVQPIAQQNPADAAQWQAEYDKISAINGTVQTAQSAIAQLNEWWASAKSAIGLSGMRGLARQGMGVLPFAIPWATIAIITAATAAVAAVVASVSALVDSLNRKAWLAENVTRREQGLPPLAPPQPSGPSIFGDVSDLGRTVLYGVLTYFLLPPLLKRLNK